MKSFRDTKSILSDIADSFTIFHLISNTSLNNYPPPHNILQIKELRQFFVVMQIKLLKVYRFYLKISTQFVLVRKQVLFDTRKLGLRNLFSCSVVRERNHVPIARLRSHPEKFTSAKPLPPIPL